jgi:hypothetical protein
MTATPRTVIRVPDATEQKIEADDQLTAFLELPDTCGADGHSFISHSSVPSSAFLSSTKFCCTKNYCHDVSLFGI